MSVDPKTERLAEDVASALMHYMAWVRQQAGPKEVIWEVTASLVAHDLGMKKFRFSISHPANEGRTMHEFEGTREKPDEDPWYKDA